MAATTASNARRQNAKPISSIIRPDLVRDADCSGMAVTPEDGQFIVVLDGVGTHETDVAFGAALGNVAMSDADGRSLRMVWGSAEHTDRRSSGHKRVPYFDGDIDVETNLYNMASDAATVASEYPGGTPLTVAVANVAVQGSTARLVLRPLAATEFGWVVGHVLETGPAAVAASGQRLKVRLYKHPVFRVERTAP
jgi:hypothetical protein